MDLNSVNVPASLMVSGSLLHNDGPVIEESHRSGLYRGMVKER